MRSFVAVALLVTIFVLAPVSGQTGPAAPTLKLPLVLVLKSDTQLDTNETIPAAKCAQVQPPAQSDSFTFTSAPLANGTVYYLDSTVSLTLQFVPADAAAGDAEAPMTPFVANVTLRMANSTIGSMEKSGPQSTTPVNLQFEFPAPSGNRTAAAGPATLVVAIRGEAGSSPVPGTLPPVPSAPNTAIMCGTSKTASFTIVKGQIGDDDLDGDGNPDSTDSDIDGDTLSNNAEPRFQCNDADFIRTPLADTSKKTDHDADGATDEKECLAGSNPFSASSLPPVPPGINWPLIIVGIVLLLILAFVVYFFMSLGKAVEVNVISPKELIVPPGGEGRFEVLLTNLKKKGNAINFQLAATGMPDGWDAKLTTDHVVLDARSGAKPQESVWLIVESPEHTDPESAVVTIKAIPLSNSGRKDTLKLAGRDRVITSINVPPNAKVPVTRGAPVQMKSEKELAQEASQPAPTPTLLPPTGVQPLAASEPAPKKGRKGKAPAPIPETTPAPSPTATPAKPQLQVGGLQHAPLSFKRGDEVKSSVTVTNNGNDPQTLKLSLFVNEALADAQTVSVKPGKTKQVQFKWQAQERNKLNIRGELVAG